MLLRHPPSGAAKTEPAEPRIEPAADSTTTRANVDEDRSVAADPSPPSRKPPTTESPARPFETWILYGQAAVSLFQAGVCRTLIADRGLPRSFYAGGFSTLNAVLLAMGGRRALDRGWERLRSRRLLFNQALRDLSFLRRFAAASRGIGWSLARERMSAPAAASPMTLHLGSGKVELRSTGTPMDAAKLQRIIEAALHEVPADPRTWRKAVAAALVEGATRIVLLGFDTEAGGAILEAASASAEHAGAELACIAYRTDEEPRAVDFLLPGSGVPERLMADGERAARDWLGNGRPSVRVGRSEAERGQ